MSGILLSQKNVAGCHVGHNPTFCTRMAGGRPRGSPRSPYQFCCRNEKRMRATPCLTELTAVMAPGMPIRRHEGMDVRVGNHIAPEGGPSIVRQLQHILDKVNRASDGPWSVHVAFETLHLYMDGNGRTGRAIWAWQMRGLGHDPFALPFLHRFYYQTLDASR